MNLSTRQKRLLRWIGYPLLAITTFIITLHLTFPYQRLKGKIIDALADKYDVTIYKIEPTTLPGGLILKTVSLKTRPTKPKEEPITILVNELRIDIGLLGLLRGRYDVDLVAELDGGTIAGNILVTGAGLEADLETKSLSLAQIPGLASAVGLPMEGGLNATMNLTLPKRRWREVDGKIKLSCPGCTVGDGVTKIKPKPLNGKTSRRRSAVFSAEGVTVPKLELGNLTGLIEIDKGVGKVKEFSAKSKDGELTIDGDIRFKDPFKNSTFPGCMRFRLTDELKQREKSFGNLPDLMRVTLDTDGFANVAMTGTLADLRWRPRKKCPTGSSGSGEKSRPTVTTRPKPTPPTAAKPDKRPGLDSPPAEPEFDGPGNSGPKLGRDFGKNRKDDKDDKDDKGGKDDINDVKGGDSPRAVSARPRPSDDVKPGPEPDETGPGEGDGEPDNEDPEGDEGDDERDDDEDRDDDEPGDDEPDDDEPGDESDPVQ